MKKTTKLLAIAVLVFAASAGAQEKFKWAEMGSFHATAMSSFHSAEINKLQPVKDSAASILKKAQAWQAAPVPAGNDTAMVKPLLRVLLSQCQNIYDAVAANKPDATLRPLVMKAHDTFHAIIAKTR